MSPMDKKETVAKALPTKVRDVRSKERLAGINTQKNTCSSKRKRMADEIIKLVDIKHIVIFKYLTIFYLW